ncbi:hypothetical protein D3227_33140 [Mesorhizobium waimense]|uniref:Uncharacterized protein n=1 Tax=Mesorhizobium waimense TaxID=1300307 RepID=A0A3A5K0T9_9HYPH|nr:hypothetical protein D3227_33140 [Mesorhizobium waimense]
MMWWKRATLLSCTETASSRMIARRRWLRPRWKVDRRIQDGRRVDALFVEAPDQSDARSTM